MLEYIYNFFADVDIPTIVARCLLALIVAVFYFVAFYYAKKRNLEAIIYVLTTCLVVLFGLSFFDIPNFAFYVYFVLGFCALACILFFGQDVQRDIFRRAWKRWFNKDMVTEEYGHEDISKSVNEIIKACQRLSKTDTGALILICDDISDHILESGTRLNSEVSADLIETLFFPKTPLHDGAVVIMANKVVAAGCYLPLTQQTNLPREFGTRHRAAIGVTEAFPTLTAIVVSEETGIISAVHDGKIQRYLDDDQLRKILSYAMRLTDNSQLTSIWGLREDE
ncbi:MAG: diadenylate cyclase [Clostridia bacterium]|nr:diadenylate cyclase [Clostridia bacterium]